MKTLHFAEAPQLLFVQLMRFFQIDGHVVKKSSRVLCSSKITINVKSDGNQTVEPCSYTLTSIVSHLGSFSGGHYTFQGRCQNSGKIFMCDDLRVEELKFFEDRHAYFLVYSKGA